MPPRPADAPPEPDYLRSPACSRTCGARAGLEPDETFDLSWAYEFADEDTMGRVLIVPDGLAVLVGPEREEQFKDALVEGLVRYRTPDGGYRLQNTFHYLIARAR